MALPLEDAAVLGAFEAIVKAKHTMRAVPGALAVAAGSVNVAGGAVIREPGVRRTAPWFEENVVDEHVVLTDRSTTRAP